MVRQRCTRKVLTWFLVVCLFEGCGLKVKTGSGELCDVYIRMRHGNSRKCIFSREERV